MKVKRLRHEKVFRALARRLRTPREVQRFLRKMSYNKEEHGETLRSALTSIKKKKAHCLEAAFIAAAVLEYHGYPPLVMSLESKDSLDHVVFIFKKGKKWGAVGRSRMEGLHGRAPVFKSLRALAYSYFDPFIDATGRVTAYGFCNLDHSSGDWRYSSKNLWNVERHLIYMPHKKMKSSNLRYRRWFKFFKLTGKSGARQKYWW